jgi:cell wall assembly regulator SMI1
MLPTEEIVDRHNLMNNEIAQEWREQGIDLSEGEAVGPVKPMLWNERWIPFAERGMDYLCLDLDPQPDGQIGQVIYYRREPEPVEWVAENLRSLMSTIAQRLEQGDFKLDQRQQIERGIV